MFEVTPPPFKRDVPFLRWEFLVNSCDFTNHAHLYYNCRVILFDNFRGWTYSATRYGVWHWPNHPAGGTICPDQIKQPSAPFCTLNVQNDSRLKVWELRSCTQLDQVTQLMWSRLAGTQQPLPCRSSRAFNSGNPQYNCVLINRRRETRRSISRSDLLVAQIGCCTANVRGATVCWTTHRAFGLGERSSASK